MDKITTDNLTGYEWFFEADESLSQGWYVQKKNGQEISRLSLKNFPNPNDVWENKINKSQDINQRDLTIEERDRLKPRQYIFDMWSDREARIA